MARRSVTVFEIGQPLKAAENKDPREKAWLTTQRAERCC